MKKQIISLLILISLSFQSTYSISSQEYMALAKQSDQKPAAKNKLRVLIDKYGVSKVREAIALVKRYKPKGVIARYQDAKKQEEVAENALRVCLKNSCNQQLGLHEGFFGDVFGKRGKGHTPCASKHCKKELEAYWRAWNRRGNWEAAKMVAGLVGAGLLFIGTAASFLYFADKADKEARLYEKTEKRPEDWLGTSPLSEANPE